MFPPCSTLVLLFVNAVTHFPYRYPGYGPKSAHCECGNDSRGHGYDPGIHHRNYESQVLSVVYMTTDAMTSCSVLRWEIQTESHL